MSDRVPRPAVRIPRTESRETQDAIMDLERIVIALQQKVNELEDEQQVLRAELSARS